MTSGTQMRLRDVWSSGPHEAFAVGNTDTMIRWDGFRWSPVVSGTTGSIFTGVWGSSSAGLFALGTNGALLRRPRHCSSVESACGDGIEDDCDGLIDCADPDCAADATCIAGGPCAAATAIACGETISDTTAGGSSQITANGCDSWLRSGREKTYRLQPPASGNVTVTLTGLTRDLDLLAFAEDAGGGCTPRYPGCLDASAAAGTDDETVGFPVVAGESYYLIVDGFEGRGADYTLSVSCP